MPTHTVFHLPGELSCKRAVRLFHFQQVARVEQTTHCHTRAQQAVPFGRIGVNEVVPCTQQKVFSELTKCSTKHANYASIPVTWPVPMAARSKAYVCWDCVRIPPGAWMSLCLLSGRGLCDELITRLQESYRLWCVVVCDLETSWMRRPWPTGGCRAKTKLYKITCRRVWVPDYFILTFNDCACQATDTLK